jgi:hypothetical protein
MTDRGLDAKCHKCGAEAGAVCRTPKGRIHKHGTHDGRGRQMEGNTMHYYTPTQVRNLLADEREACAKVCDAQAESHELLSNTQAAKGCDDCATAIRARGSNVT